MGKNKHHKSAITSFTSRGDFLVILHPQPSLNVWNTLDGTLLAEWKPSDENASCIFSSMTCVYTGKKRKPKKGTFLVALGTDGGDVLVIDVVTAEMKWKSSACLPGGIVSLSFSNDGSKLHAVSTKGMVSEMNSKNGELLKVLELSKESIISTSFCDEKILAATTSHVRVFGLEDGNELVKFPADSGSVRHISVSDDAKAIITSDLDKKHLQMWKCEWSTGIVNTGPILSMKSHPLNVECKKGSSAEDGVVVLSVSVSGVTYIWNFNMSSDDEVNPTKISVQKTANELNSTPGKARKNRASIFAARIHALNSDDQATVLVAYGSMNSPKFSFLDIPRMGEDVVITADKDAIELTSIAEQNVTPEGGGLDEIEAAAGLVQKVKPSKKRAAREPETANMEALLDHGHGEPMDGVQVDYDLNEPTMGEKLVDLNLAEGDKVENPEQQQLPQTKLPSADSVHLLLKQALHADDRALLLDCLRRKDEKVVANSISLLNTSDILKLLQSLIPIVQSRGAVLACALPWLRSLLLQHSSGIMSHESSLAALNSLYQLIESRVSSYNPVVQLSSSLDLLYAGTIDDDDGDDDNNVVSPTIYEDRDESDEEEYGEAMETDKEDKIEAKTFSDFSDIDEMD
ncbi:Utp12 domain-containing protein [Heracleum sosnowskyi]|uniref:Utp12 domain-containing protein n=1 Tax=Heracleum sosnowskyi TaxID=360622 RepID=A0AAD8HD11_9APIA|nr:Utp12 domain-containing protein [Heracleum sosnowskyi]